MSASGHDSRFRGGGRDGACASRAQSRSGLAAIAIVAIAVALITGCGGGGGGDGDGSGGGGGDDFFSAGGIWEGTITTSGGSAKAFRGLVTEDGEFGVVVSNQVGFLAIGQGDTQGNDRFQATATAFASSGSTLPDGSTRATGTFQGTFITGSRLSGTYSVGGETGSFDLRYQSLYDRLPSLAALSGVWTLAQAPGSPPVTMAINSNGDLTLSTSSGCTANGRFVIVDPEFNAYRSSGTFGNCGAPLDGNWRFIAHLADAEGTTNNRLWVYGLAVNSSAAGVQLWTK